MAGGETNAAKRITGGGAAVAPSNAPPPFSQVPDAPPVRLMEGAGSGSARLFEQRKTPERFEPLTRDELFTDFERSIPSMGGVGDFLAEQVGILPGNRDRILAEANAARKQAGLEQAVRGHQIFKGEVDRIESIKGFANKMAAAEAAAPWLDHMLGEGTGDQLIATVLDVQEMGETFADHVQADPVFETYMNISIKEGSFKKVTDYMKTDAHQKRLLTLQDNKFLPFVQTFVTRGMDQLETEARADPNGKVAKDLKQAKASGKIDPAEYMALLNRHLTEDVKFNANGTKKERTALRVFQDNAETIQGFTDTGAARARQREIDAGKGNIVTLVDTDGTVSSMLQSDPELQSALDAGMVVAGKERRPEDVLKTRIAEIKLKDPAERTPNDIAILEMEQRLDPLEIAMKAAVRNAFCR